MADNLCVNIIGVSPRISVTYTPYGSDPCDYILVSTTNYQHLLNLDSMLSPDPQLMLKYFSWGFSAVLLCGVIGIFVGHAVAAVRAARYI
jgi:hypothetical protein